MYQKLASLLTVTILVSVLIFSGIGLAEEYDFGGETINVWQWYNVLGAFEEGGLFEGRLAEAEERFNVNIVAREFAPNTIDTFVARLLAGDSTNDIWMLRGPSGYYQLISRGALYPLGDLMPEDAYAGVPDNFADFPEQYSFKGQQYGYVFYLPFPANTTFVAWNKELFEEADLPSLYDVYFDGEWTWDKYLEFAQTLTKDTTGDGEIDQWGLAGLARDELHFSNNASIIGEEDGKVVFTLNKPEAIRSYEFMRKTWESGAANMAHAPWRDGKAGMMVYEMWIINMWSDHLDWGVVPLPMGPDADDHVFPNTSGMALFSIPVNSSHPEAKAALLRYLWRPEEMEEAVIDNIRGFTRDREMAQVLMEGFAKTSAEYNTLLLGESWNRDRILGDAVIGIIHGEQTAQAGLDAIADAAQAALDDMFE